MNKTAVPSVECSASPLGVRLSLVADVQSGDGRMTVPSLVTGDTVSSCFNPALLLVVWSLMWSVKFI